MFKDPLCRVASPYLPFSPLGYGPVPYLVHSMLYCLVLYILYVTSGFVLNRIVLSFSPLLYPIFSLFRLLLTKFYSLRTPPCRLPALFRESRHFLFLPPCSHVTASQSLSHSPFTFCVFSPRLANTRGLYRPYRSSTRNKMAA